MNAEHPIHVAVGHQAASDTPPTSPKVATERAQPIQAPLIDIYEGADGLVLEADLPGVSPENVAIQLEDNILALHARVGSSVPQGARLVHEEFRHADFQRSFILSDEVDRERITAELKNGVLRLSLPKADRARPRRIEIQSS